MANVVASPSEAFHTNISETHLRRVAWRSSSSYSMYTWVQYIIPESFQESVGECCRASVNFLLSLYFYKILIDCPPLPLGPRIARAMQSVVVILPQLTAVAGGTLPHLISLKAFHCCRLSHHLISTANNKCFYESSTTEDFKKMPKIDTLDALEEHEEHEDDYQTNSN